MYYGFQNRKLKILKFFVNLETFDLYFRKRLCSLKIFKEFQKILNEINILFVVCYTIKVAILKKTL